MRSFYFLLLFIYPLFASSLHLSISSNPSKLNPLIATDSASGEIADWIFESLVGYDKDGNIEPKLAESYRFEDNTTLIFKLREGVKWSDGVKFSAQDVVFTYNLITSPKIFTPYADSFRYVKSVEALDELSVKVTYKEPYFKALHTWMTAIVPKHILENEKEIMTSKFNRHPIGCGKYTIDGFEVSKDIVLKANPNYYIRKPRIDKIIYHFMPDPSTQFLMLKSGKLDVGSLTPLQMERQIDDKFKERYNFFEKISNGYTYMGFNLNNPKFKDSRVREALSHAIDRKEIVDILFFGHAQVCTGPFMPGTFAFNSDVKAPKQDIKRAKELLKEAGYDKDNPLKFEIVTNSNNPIRVYAAQILQHQLREAGVVATIRTMEWQAFLNTVVMPRNFEAVILGWGLGLMPDAYSIWHSEGIKKGGFNFVGYKNRRVDKLIKEAERSVDMERVGEIYREIFKLIAEDNPYLFLYIPNSITVVNRDIKNVSSSIIGVMHNVIDWIKP
jgi:peptide/nickel transport system substrate-binding protein